MIAPALERIPLACPLDGLPLSVAEHGLRCARGHDFNRSRHGYVNLLPVGLKPSKDPGDGKAMVEARRQVLELGVFEPVADALDELLVTHARSLGNGAPLLVDAGCGEGWYTDRFRAALQDAMGDSCWSVLGVDISRWAVTAAAKRYESSGWVVGNNKRLPVMSGSIGIITSLFGFETWQPWAALQTPGQLVVTVAAGPRHLMELRELVYREVELHEPPDDTQAAAAGYLTTSECRIERVVALDAPGLAEAILAMTPHGHRIDTARRATLDLSSMDSLTLDVVVRSHVRG